MRAVAVDQYTLDGEFVKTWDSATQAKENIKSASKINEVCRGRRKQSAGYVWRYNKEPFNKFDVPTKIDLGNEYRRKTTAAFKHQVYKETNGEYFVIGKYKNSFTKITFKHIECGNIYRQTPSDFSSGCRCPFCAGRRHTTKEISKKVASKYKPNEYIMLGEFRGMLKKVEIKHKCGRVMYVTPSSFLRGDSHCRCVSKSGGKYNTNTFRDEVYRITNGKYSFISAEYKVNTELKFRNNITLATFKMKPLNFLSGSRENLLTYKGEVELDDYLTDINVFYKKQNRINYSRNRRGFVDFYLPDYNTFIEFDGQQHHEPVKHFGGEEGLRKTQERDALKNAYAYEHGIKMIRIPYCYLNHIKEFLDPFFAKNKPINK